MTTEWTKAITEFRKDCRRALQSPRDITPAVTLDPDGYFRAINTDTYDVDCDHTGFFTRSPQGFGRTPLDAIVDLLDNMAEG